MDIWQFWLSIGIIFALLGVIIAILIRKHKDKHKIAALHKNIEDLEKSFLHLQENMEIATNQYLNAMEVKCESMRELLSIADKKCLYAGDLINAIDKGVEILKERNLSGGMPVASTSNIDEKYMATLRKEFSTVTDELRNEINSLNRHLGFINKRVEELEQNLTNESSKQEDFDENMKSSVTKEIADLKKEIKNISFSLSEMVTNEISSQLEGLDTGFAEIANKAIELDEKELNSLNNEPATGVKGKITELFPKIIDSPLSTHNRKTKTLTEVNKEDIKMFLPKGKELVVKEILEKYEQGTSIPQIASELNMSRGEIDLIIKMNENIGSIDKVGNYGN